MAKVSYELLVNTIFEENSSIDSLFNFVKLTYGYDAYSEKSLKTRLETFFKNVKARLRNVNFSKTIFKERHGPWLKNYFDLEEKHSDLEPTPSPSKSGRPRKTFGESSNRSKRRKALEARTSLGEEGIQYLLENKENIQGLAIPLTNEEALALYLDLNLTKAQYMKLRQVAKDHQSNLFPSYNNILMAKKECYPENISTTETGSTVGLQELLDHTSTRLIRSLIREKDIDIYSNSLKLISKWGCDGSSGQSEYKQGFSHTTSRIDAHVFMISMVPISLVDSDGKTLWENQQPSSTKYCRPIKFEFEKETRETVQQEISELETQINALRPTLCRVSDSKDFLINHSLLSTMVDGKICQILTDTPSSQQCVNCGAKSKEMNDLELVKSKNVNRESLKYGLSSLHAWIRFMECLLHISYNLQFGCLAARSEEQKNIKSTEKKRIQEDFRREMSLIIDIPRQGSGTSNDGNTARRFFKDPEKTSEITKIDVNLVRRFGIILQVLASGNEIDKVKFAQYLDETAKLYVELYNWYPMPTSVHRILIHGCDIISNFTLPIGKLSEDSQEARNKDYRKFREHNTRKMSRKASNEDLLHLLLATSDPFITNKRQFIKCNKKELDVEALELLI